MPPDPKNGAGGDANAPRLLSDRLTEATVDKPKVTQVGIYQPEVIKIARRWVSKHRVSWNAALVLAALALRCRND